MTTDTKAVARWDFDVEVDDYEQFNDGNYILFTDHERLVGELRAEIEALVKDAERYRWLRNDAMNGSKHDPAVLKDGPADCCEFMFDDELDSAIDAAMEKGNV